MQFIDAREGVVVVHRIGKRVHRRFMWKLAILKGPPSGYEVEAPNKACLLSWPGFGRLLSSTSSKPATRIGNERISGSMALGRNIMGERYNWPWPPSSMSGENQYLCNGDWLVLWKVWLNWESGGCETGPLKKEKEKEEWISIGNHFEEEDFYLDEL